MLRRARPSPAVVMPRTRIRLTLSTTTKPPQPSLPHHYTTPPSLLNPISPRLKSPAFFLSTSSTPYHRNHQSPFPSPSFATQFATPHPQSPLAWTWRCHLCQTTYRLGTTRRCLLDGHYFCSPPPPPPPTPPSPVPSPEGLPAESSEGPLRTTTRSPTSSSSSSSSSSFSSRTTTPPLPLAQRSAYVPCGAGAVKAAQKELAKRQERRAGEGGPKKRCKKIQRDSCVSSFDYLGWVQWNAWRRGELSLGARRGRAEIVPAGDAGLRSANASASAMAAGPGEELGFAEERVRKDCFRDCDFPSECAWRRSSGYLESVLEEGEPVASF